MTRLRLTSIAVALLAMVAVPGLTAATAADPEKPMLTKKPAEWTTSQDADFEFTRVASDEIELFECRLDAAPLFVACTPDALPPEGSQVYTDLTEGSHTFRVRAVSEDGPGDARTFSWTIDRTPPVMSASAEVVAEATSAAGASVTYPLPSATDALDDQPKVVCAPAPGALFPLGESTVTCTPTDRAGNEGTPASFSLRVRDTTGPTLNAPAVGAEATSAAGASVTYALPTATDAVDDEPDVVCAPAPGTFFPFGESTVTCTATDGAGNKGTASFPVRVRDTTAPTLNAPANVVAEATSAAGASVTYPLPSAADAVDDEPEVVCAPASGALFPLGESTGTCTATDSAGNKATASFTVRVRDTTPPTLNPYPDIVTQQDSPTGATVAFDPWPTATDAVDGVVAAACTPNATAASPAFFPLESSPVVCAATDAAGNASAASTLFHVIVNDGPAPPQPTITAHPGSLSRSATAAFEFVASDDVTTTCRLDGPSPQPTRPCQSEETYPGLEDGLYVFTVEATDNEIGTVSQATYSWEVDTTPPQPIEAFGGRARAGAVTLTWHQPADPDHAHSRIWRQRVGGPWRFVKELGDATRFTDTGLANDVVFRYRIQSYDPAGNASSPVYTRERPSRVFAPQYEAVLTRPPLVDWTSVRRATYYNVQVWRRGHKILSLWPWRSRLEMRATWRYHGRTYTLSAAGYTVLVWPGFGSKAAARYGPLLGSTSFRVG